MRSLRFARVMTATVVVMSLAALSASASGASDAQRERRAVTPVTLPPSAITTYDVQYGADMILYGQGEVWTFDARASTLHHVALGSGRSWERSPARAAGRAPYPRSATGSSGPWISPPNSAP